MDPTTKNPTTSSTTSSPTTDKFDTMSFVYGALAGSGGILIIAIIIVLCNGKRKKHRMNSYELDTYVDNDVA